MVVPPLVILAIGIFVVLSLIIVFRVNAFLAMIAAALIVSLLAPGAWDEKIIRVVAAFGTTAGKIGIVIAMAAIIGRCLIDSGAADRVVRLFVRAFGEKRCPASLMASGFVLSVPVFFDTVFYLLLPLARSMHRQTGKRYVLLILAMGAGASITHSLVPPTPGPLLIAGMLDIDIGVMICVGALVAACTAFVMLFFIKFLSSKIDIPMRPLEGSEPEPEPLPDDQLPGLAASLAPIILPVLLIASKTVVDTVVDTPVADTLAAYAKNFTSVAGNPSFAMFLSAVIAMFVLWRQRKPSRVQLAAIVENALMSGGIIILITSAGGAFGAMLKTAEIGPAIQQLVAGEQETPQIETDFAALSAEADALSDQLADLTKQPYQASKDPTATHANLAPAVANAQALAARAEQVALELEAMAAAPPDESEATAVGLSGMQLLFMAFLTAFLIKFAQGSSTVAMMTSAAMMAPLIGNPELIGFHPVYLACAIGFGAQCGNWMNDSGFWIFAKMSGLTEMETLKTWTVTVSTLAVVGFLFTILFAKILPLTSLI